MGRIGFFLAGLLIGGAAVMTSLKYHVVRAEDGFHLVPKLSSRFGEAYIDIRGFNLSDWDNHRSVAAAIARSDQSYLLKGAAAATVGHSVGDLIQNLSIPGRDDGSAGARSR